MYKTTVINTIIVSFTDFSIDILLFFKLILLFAYDDKKIFNYTAIILVKKIYLL